jgi:cell wall-associated NlpC family hydrolase
MPKKPKSADSYTVAVPVTELLDNPANGARVGRRDSQLLYGETFIVDSRERLWLHGKNKTDGYKGYVHQSALRPEDEAPTHAVTRLFTGLYTQPDFKTRPETALGFMARIVIEKTEKNGFVKTPGGWIYKSHLRKISDLKKNKDHAEYALLFLGCPYLYGGRSPLGLDCSALVQLSLNARGIACPRDADQQAVAGKKASASSLRRGDLVFFTGFNHVGIMLDEKNILNATARTMDVRIEKISDLVKIYKGIAAVRRI